MSKKGKMIEEEEGIVISAMKVGAYVLVCGIAIMMLGGFIVVAFDISIQGRCVICMIGSVLSLIGIVIVVFGLILLEVFGGMLFMREGLDGCDKK